jgi:hypothetical protein
METRVRRVQRVWADWKSKQQILRLSCFDSSSPHQKTLVPCDLHREADRQAIEFRSPVFSIVVVETKCNTIKLGD